MTRGPSSRQNYAKPLHATARTPGSTTDGDQVRAVAKLLGTPLLPWQELAADIALERDDSGAYRHKIVVITVPRQSGKTTLLRAIAVQKMLAHHRRQIWYTAQTGKDARARWDDLVEAIQHDPHARRQFTIRKSAGSAAIVHERSRSRFSPFAPTAESLHGYTPHDVMVDEVFALSEVEGHLLLGAIIPAQATIADRQLYLVSTKGTADSTFFQDWVDAGRAGQSGVAIIEYAAADDVDIYDPAAWETFHPALHLTIGPDAIADAAKTLSRGEFERAYGNRPTATESHLVEPAHWATLAEAGITAGTRPWALTYDVAFDGSAAVIRATWTTDDGKHASAVLERRPGYTWLAEAVTGWVDAGAPQAIAADDGGLAREVNAVLAAGPTKYQPTILDGRDYSTACTSWLERVRAGDYLHDGDPVDATNVGGLAQRQIGDSWAFSRRHSAGDVSGPIAAAIGTYAVTFLLKSHSRPLISFGAA